MKIPFFSSLFFLFLSSPAAAQGCAMCRSALEGQVESVVQAVNLGISGALDSPADDYVNDPLCHLSTG